jgi:SulP family sulfate permease
VFRVVGGVVVAIALSIGVFLYRAARPHDAVLGRVDEVDGYHDIARWEDAETVPGLLVYRFDAPPFFVNAAYLRQRVLALADASNDLRWLVLNAEAWTYLDSTAIDALTRLHRSSSNAASPSVSPPEGTAARELRGDGPHRPDRA